MDIFLLFLLALNNTSNPALQHFIQEYRLPQEFPQRQIPLSVNKYTRPIILPPNIDYNMLFFRNILNKVFEDSKFKEKFIEIHNNITLRKTEESNTFYKHLFMLLKKFQPFAIQPTKINKIEIFQQLFEKTSLKNKNELFSFWCTLTFPNFPVNDFLKDSIKLTKEKVKDSKDFPLNQILFFVFPNKNPYINYNTTPILVKVWEYLESRDIETKQRLLREIAQSCYNTPILACHNHQIQTNPLHMMQIDNHNIVLIYYQIPNTNLIVALTEKSSLSSLSIREFIQNDYNGHIYFGSHNLACIVFPNLETLPNTFLTDQDIKSLMDIQGGIILTNESHLKTPLCYSPIADGGIYFCTLTKRWNETNQISQTYILHLSKIIKKNQKLFEQIKEQHLDL